MTEKFKVQSSTLNVASRWRAAPTPCCVLLCALSSVLLLPACSDDVKVIRYDPFLARLPGAEGGEPPVGKRAQSEIDPHDVPKEELIIKNPDGSVTLISHVTRQLIAHLSRLMEEGDDDLLYDQLISKQTKAHFLSEGKDPKHEVKTYFAENREDIYALLARMPAGERTPGVTLTKIASSQFKLTITGTAARGTNFTEMWVVMENGNWKLWWFA